MEEAVSEEYKKDLRDQMQKFIQGKEKEFQKKQEETARRFEDEKRQIQAATEQSLRKSISNDFEHKLRLLEDANRDNNEKLRASREKELSVQRRLQ
jgi:hypothetical protein